MTEHGLQVRVRCSTWRLRVALYGLKVALALVPLRYAHLPVRWANTFVDALERGGRLFRYLVRVERA